MQCYEKNTFINANYLYKSMLRIMRNEIYARHGYNFASADLKNISRNRNGTSRSKAIRR